MNDSDDGRTLSAGALQGTEASVPGVETLRQIGVLVADDQDYIRYTLDRTLRGAGFLVWVAAGGREALDLYRAHPGAIDVVVLDVRMPGMDGPQTLAALREVAPRVRCCFLNGDFGVYTEAQLLAMGAGAVLYKPARPEKLIGAVRLLANGAAVGPVAG
jgi:DNA-binding NarL/FixJ family response regulator